MEETQGTPRGAPQAPEPKKKAGCLKTGCLGCLGLGAILIGVVGLMLLTAVIQGPPEKNPERANLSRALPGPPDARDLPDVPLETVAPGGTVLAEGSGEGASRVAARPGRILLDLTMGEFEIVPGPAGQPIRVEADYDSGAYELTESFDPGGEAGWTYELSFGSRVSLFRQMLGGSNPEQNRIKLIIPRDVPVAVSGRVGIGVSRIELGGLWLTDLALNIGIGEHRVSFKEPTREPVEEVFLRASIGEFALRGLGNASPRHATVTQSLGESRFDLRGRWVRDASVTLKCGIGECSVRLPRGGVNVQVDRATLMIGESNTADLGRREPAPEGAPTVTLNMSQTIGELNIRD